jgi:glucose/arabinose dehydrogenase
MRVASALAALLAALVVVVGPARAAVRLTPVTTASQPVYVTHAGDRRLFIVELAGRIRIFDGGALLTVPFLDISAKVSSGGERGLLSLAFHPDHASNGFFYVYYTAIGGNLTVERYHVGANPNQAEAASAATLLSIPHPASNHNGGQLQVGPRDGFLYVGTGDGGGAGDGPCNAQRADVLLGKLLRLDVRKNLNVAPFYGIPSGNPFTGAADPANAIPDEIWATGLRNPWRFSFDRATGDLFIGDVGQNAVEEVDLQRAGSAGGQNYGWKVMEGPSCFSTENCPAATPPCGSAAFTSPIHSYGHGGDDCSITGGYVYRGPANELSGRYLFADYCAGAIRALSPAGAGWQVTSLLAGAGSIGSFGEDASGEVYVTAGNGVWRVTSDSPARQVPALGPVGLVALLLGLLRRVRFRA